MSATLSLPNMMASQIDTPPSAPEDSKDFALSPISSNGSEEFSTVASPTSDDAVSNGITGRLPSLRASSDAPLTATMTPSSTHLGMVNNARRPAPTPTLSSMRAGGGLSQDMQAKMRAFAQSRQNLPGARPQLPTTASGPPTSTPSPGGGNIAGLPGGLRLPPNMANLRPHPQGVSSAPVVPRMPKAGGLSARRGAPVLGGLPGASPATGGGPPKLSLSGNGENPAKNGNEGSMFTKFSKFVDTKAGILKFPGQAVIHSQGIDFTSGSNFTISLEEVDTLEELGHGNYGTVYKVRHARPRNRKPGQGLAGNKSTGALLPGPENTSDSVESIPQIGGTSGIVMAMKEIRLELDEAKFAAIIMELDILHRCVSPYIIDFYGAFFQEGAVYICIEYMDGGSIDNIYGDGVPENVLRKITYATTIGLKSLKDQHNIIHRDVKPTNILVNTRGQVKICDFGVSGNLVASIAKTNIGCQSYMAPERISGGGIAQAGANPGGGTYSVQSDIWSLGLSIIECALGRYPYPPETYNNIFSQLSAIVDGDPPDLPEDGYSPLARDFVRGCLNKIPKLRPTYSMLLAHGWLASLSKPTTISEEDEELAESLGAVELASEGGMGSGGGGVNAYDKEVADWCLGALEKKRSGKMASATKPALHAAPMDSISPAASPAA